MTMTCEDWLRQENEQLQADLAAAQRELAACQKAVDDYNDPRFQHIAAAWWIKNRVAELLAQEGGKPHVNVGTLGHVDHGKTALTAALTKVGTQPQSPNRAESLAWREPTIEDAVELLLKFRNTNLFKGLEIDMIMSLEQLGFVRKVQP